MTTKKILTREEFRSSFIKPLEDKFKYKVYWNSKDLKEVGLESTYARGVSNTDIDGFPIVMRYTKNSLDMLNTLVHEYGHSHLHNKNEKGFNLSKNMKEFEAESVAIRAFELLNLDYPGGNYADRHYLKCSFTEIAKCREKKRELLIESLAKDISDVLRSKVSLIKELNSTFENRQEENYKYKIVCPFCNNVWKYKRATKIIKNKAKGCYCNACGKEKTLNKLFVESI